MFSLSACALVCLLSGADGAVMLEFTAEWCGACQAVEPTVQRLTSEGYPIQRVQIDQQPGAAAQYRVTAVPCFILMVGGREVDRVVGAASYARLSQMFARTGFSPPNVGAIAGNQANEVVRGQSPPAGGFGLPRPLAAFAKGFGGNDSPVAMPAQQATPEPTPAAPTSTRQGMHQGMPGMAPVHDPRAAAPAATSHLQAPPSQIDPRTLQQATLATVRLRVEDGTGHSVGTGTIVDTHGDEALVVTCGHVFRDSQGKGRISVDLFAEGQPRTVPGNLISYDLDRDIALVAITPGVRVTPMRVAPASYRLARGQTVFSLGCDKGADPTPRVSSINSIDRYVGAPNLQVAGMPVDGRSGGGLFSADGLMIGLCNAADPQDQEGIFASLPVIHWELDKIGQRRIYDQPSESLAAQSPAPAVAAAAVDHSLPASAIPQVLPTGLPNHAAVPTAAPLTPVGADTEVICIVRTQGSERLLVLDRPSRELLDRLASESQSRGANEIARHTPTDLTQPSPTVSPVVRAQSDM